MDFWIKDPKTKQRSVTLTLLITGFVVCVIKLLTSGVDIGIVKLAQFGGGDFAASIGALGAIYAARKATDKKPPKE